MSFMNETSKVVDCKVVYYGPPTTSLQENLAYIHAKTHAGAKSAAVLGEDPALSTYLPMSLGAIRGFATKLHLYTAPRTPGDEESRRVTLEHVDGVVFVADSDPVQLPATLDSWGSLERNLQILGYDRRTLPIVVQLEQRARPGAITHDELKSVLGLTTEPVIEAIVGNGIGVFDTLKAITTLVLTELKKG